MNDSNHTLNVTKVDLAILLGHTSALRAVTELFYQELRCNGLLPDKGKFSDEVAEELEKALSNIVSRRSVFQDVYDDSDKKELAVSTFHNEVLYIFQDRFDS